MGSESLKGTLSDLMKEMLCEFVREMSYDWTKGWRFPLRFLAISPSNDLMRGFTDRLVSSYSGIKCENYLLFFSLFSKEK